MAVFSCLSVVTGKLTVPKTRQVIDLHNADDIRKYAHIITLSNVITERYYPTSTVKLYIVVGPVCLPGQQQLVGDND